MSKSVSGQDVEDMLSSVRRLVSNELPRNRRTSLPEGPGALVLTDAQRIEPSMIGHNSPPKTLEDRIAELEAAVSESTDEWEPDGSEDQDQHRPDRIVYKPPEEEQKGGRRRSLRLSEIALIETGPANDDDAEISDPVSMTATFRHEGEDEEPLSLQEEMRADDVVAPTDNHVSDTGDKPPEESQSEIPETNDKHDDDIVPDDTAGAELDASGEPVLDDIDPEPEAEEGSIDPTPETDEGVATGEAFEEALAEAVAASLPDATIKEIERHEAEISTEPEDKLNGDPDAAEIDKSTLQPLVASLIREELQGELGERITRNVRKLVRQEIQRALAVRELE